MASKQKLPTEAEIIKMPKSEYMSAVQLKFFRDGGVWGKDARANSIMSTIARDLSDEEIQGLATYLEGLHPAPAPKPAP